MGWVGLTTLQGMGERCFPIADLLLIKCWLRRVLIYLGASHASQQARQPMLWHASAGSWWLRSTPLRAQGVYDHGRVLTPLASANPFVRMHARTGALPGGSAAQQGDDDVIILSQPARQQGGPLQRLSPGEAVRDEPSQAARPQPERSARGARSQGGTPLEQGCTETATPSSSGSAARGASEHPSPLLRGEASLEWAAPRSCGAITGAAAPADARRVSLTSLFTPLPGAQLNAPDQASPPGKAWAHHRPRPSPRRISSATAASLAAGSVGNPRDSLSGREASEAPVQASNQENDDPRRNMGASPMPQPRCARWQCKISTLISSLI